MHLAMVELDYAGAAVQILLRPMVVRIVAGLARRHSFATEITAKYQVWFDPAGFVLFFSREVNRSQYQSLMVVC